MEILIAKKLLRICSWAICSICTAEPCCDPMFTWGTAKLESTDGNESCCSHCRQQPGGDTDDSEAKDTKYIVFHALNSTFNTLDSFYTVLGALSERCWHWGGQVKKSRAQFGKLNSWLRQPSLGKERKRTRGKSSVKCESRKHWTDQHTAWEEWCCFWQGGGSLTVHVELHGFIGFETLLERWLKHTLEHSTSEFSPQVM